MNIKQVHDLDAPIGGFMET